MTRTFIATIIDSEDGVSNLESRPLGAILGALNNDLDSEELTDVTLTLYEVERVQPSERVDLEDDEDGEPPSAWLIIDRLGELDIDFCTTGIADMGDDDIDGLQQLLDSTPAATRAEAFNAWAAAHPRIGWGWWSVLVVDGRARWADLTIDARDPESWGAKLPEWAKEITDG